MPLSQSDIARLFHIESGGNPYAVTGSNRGLGQFGPEEERRFGINNANRNDPNAQAAAVQSEYSAYAPKLAQVLGRTPSPGEFYLAHQQGAAGGPALLSADPNTPAWQAIRQYYGSDAVAMKAIGGNIPRGSPLYGKDPGAITAGDFTNYWINKFQDPNAANNMQLSGDYSGGGDGSIPAKAKAVQYTPNDLASAMAAMSSPSASIGNGLVNAGAALQSVYDPLGASVTSGLAKNAMAMQLAGRPEFKQIGADMFGQPQYGFVDLNKQTITPASGSGGATGTGGASGGLGDTLAQIEAARANGAKPEDLLNMVPAAIRSDLKAMISNTAMPTNLTRSGPMRNALLMFGHAIDPTFDETALPGRIKYQRDLASNSATTAGGQKVLLGTSLEHLLPLSQSAVDLQNSDGMNLPITGPIAAEARAENALKNATTGNAAKVTALENNADRYSGEVGKLYSGNQGGGVHERQESRNRYSGNLPPAQLAAALETDLGLMLGKTSELEKQYHDTMGKEAGSTFLGPDRQKMIDQVRANIATLKGLKNSAASTNGGNKPSLDSIFGQ